jgi:hypothetical protein
MISEAPQNPAGAYISEVELSPQRRDELITVIETTPPALRNAVENLTEGQLATKYRNWTIRQIVHHLADSHVNSYVRFKWTLTEDFPTIKAYDEGRWAALDDSRQGDLQPALALLTGLHLRWVQLLRSISDEQFRRSFNHPETKAAVRLTEALGYYAWHCRHHVGQILWLRDQHHW